jgi:FHS family Na+ dependent glucose MFS transporter 1
LKSQIASPVRLPTALCAYFAAFIAIGAVMAIGGPALPWLAEHTSSSLEQFSIIFITGPLGYMLGSQLGGRLFDRLPGHRLLSMALLVVSAGLALVPVLNSLWVLVAVLFVLGIFQGSVDVGCNTLLTWTYEEKVTPFMNTLHASYGVGTFLAPLIFAQVVRTAGDIQWAYWFFSLLTIPLAAWFWFLPSPPIRRKPEIPAGERSTTGMFLLVILFYVFIVGLEVGYGNWIYTFSVRLGMADITQAAYLTSAFWGAFTISRLVGIGISARVRPQTILLADLLGCLAAFAVLFAWQDSTPALWAGTILMGFSVASVFATGLAFAEQQMRLTGSMIGWILVGGGVGAIASPWLIGQLFENIGPRVTMPILLGFALASLGSWLSLVLARKR